jgi:magnesium chelatase subunit D
MTEGGPAAGCLADAELALSLFLTDPQGLGGLWLHGDHLACETLLDALRAALPPATPWKRLPASLDAERLHGGLDLAASLSSGRAVRQAGLLEEAVRGIVVAPLAERLEQAISGPLAQWLDGPRETRPLGLVLMDQAGADDETPPLSLLERVAFHLDLSEVTRLEPCKPRRAGRDALKAMREPSPDVLHSLAYTAAALGISSMRAPLYAIAAARAHAALNGRSAPEAEDVAVAARLVLAPRATSLPAPPEADDQPPPPQESRDEHDRQEDDGDTKALDEQVLEAAMASLPPDVLARIADGAAKRAAGGSRSGKRNRSAMRGRPKGARQGMPGGGARLALIDTLRAAAPWQAMRRRQAMPGDDRLLHIRKDDLHIRRFEQRTATVTIFCVDASGSAAFARLAEAKGAVELLLAQAYVKRSEVALLAFRGERADILLPPTRSLTRARRALAELPGGGGTPLASGIGQAALLAETIERQGRTPFIVLLTDGSANIGADGSPGRQQAREDAQLAARGIAARGYDAVIIDISPRPRRDAEVLAETMRARYLPLPMANAGAIESAVSAAQRSAGRS